MPLGHKGRKGITNASESFCHMLQTAGYPQQRTRRIAARRGINDIFQIADEGGVLGRFFCALRPADELAPSEERWLPVLQSRD